MAYDMGKSPLRMKCPHCGKVMGHYVVKTDPRNYHWDNEHVPLFKRIAGTDISYRLRTKRCLSCKKEFDTVEMANHFLDALVDEIDRLAGALTSAEDERAAENRAAFELQIHAKDERDTANKKAFDLQRAVDRAHASLVRHRSPPKS